jgi:hypothetical protein
MTSPPPRSEKPKTPHPRTETPVKSALKAAVNWNEHTKDPVPYIASRRTKAPHASDPASPVSYRRCTKGQREHVQNTVLQM